MRYVKEVKLFRRAMLLDVSRAAQRQHCTHIVFLPLAPSARLTSPVI